VAVEFAPVTAEFVVKTTAEAPAPAPPAPAAVVPLPPTPPFPPLAVAEFDASGVRLSCASAERPSPPLVPVLPAVPFAPLAPVMEIVEGQTGGVTAAGRLINKTVRDLDNFTPKLLG
jgi:hypothetical protein